MTERTPIEGFIPTAVRYSQLGQQRVLQVEGAVRGVRAVGRRGRGARGRGLGDGGGVLGNGRELLLAEGQPGRAGSGLAVPALVLAAVGSLLSRETKEN